MSSVNKILSPEDYKLPDGSTDWPAYHKAQVENGDLCWQCEGLAHALGGSGRRDLCWSCKTLQQDTNREVTHDSHIRCPKCGALDDVTQWDCDSDETKYREGEHTVQCSSCEFEYEIETEASYSYTSPPRFTEEDKEP